MKDEQPYTAQAEAAKSKLSDALSGCERQGYVSHEQRLSLLDLQYFRTEQKLRAKIMTTTTKTKATVSPERLAELEKSEQELIFLKAILPNIISKGAIASLHERPAKAENCLSWHSISDVELKGDRSESGNYEKLRRSFLGLQAYNASVGAQQALYPTVGNLLSLSEVDTSIASRWTNEPLIATELGAYCDPLTPGWNSEDERERHNSEMLRNVKGGIGKLVIWPATYD